MEPDAQNHIIFHMQNHPKEKNPIKRKKYERSARHAKGEFLFFRKAVSSIFLTTNLTTILTAILTAIRFEKRSKCADFAAVSGGRIQRKTPENP